MPLLSATLRALGATAGSIAACVFAASLHAQANLVQINEVNFATAGGADGWIEVANFGAQPVDVGAWSIFQGTRTPGRAGAYWWPIPPGTTIPAQGFLRVRWMRPIDQSNTNPLLIDTGDTSYHFLFLLRGEPLSRSAGALALVASKDGNEMANPAVYRDFVVWGNDTNLFPREDLAVANGRWLVGARVPSPVDDQSLALIHVDLSEPTPPSAWYRDASPTPSRANHSNESATVFGSPCVLGLGQPSALSFRSLPIHGNVDFRLQVDNLGPGAATLALVVGFPDEVGSPWIAPCNTYIDFARPLLALPFLATTDTFEFRPPYEAESGKTLAVQVVAQRSNAVALTAAGRMRLLPR